MSLGALLLAVTVALAAGRGGDNAARAAAVGGGSGDVDIASLVYLNARLALREARPMTTVDLWLLRNAHEDQTGHVSPFDADFRSLTWAALGELGACQDGFGRDDDGAGLWPLALHNQIVRGLGRSKPARRPRAFAAFEVGRQERPVAITDVLSADELATFKLRRTRCAGPRNAAFAAGESITADLSDRQVVARTLRHLLERAKWTLAADRVRGRAAIEARLFDLDLELTALAERDARARAREAASTARDDGVSREAIAAMSASAPRTTLNPDSRAAVILRECAAWPASEWLSLSPERRLFLYAHARAWDPRPAQLGPLGLAIVDALAAEGDGDGVDAWIGVMTDGGEVPPAEVWGGARGQALLGLDDAAGFRERGVIALHRGVDQLGRGELADALRSFAFARRHAEESRAGEAVAALSLRWLSYVAGQFAVSAELLATLQELVPRQDYGVLLEDLAWTAAFHADSASFREALDHQLGQGALTRRLALLAPLAAGDVERFSTGVAKGLAESPSETLRFLDQLVERLEVEDATVRAAHVPTLVKLRRLLTPLAEVEGERSGRTAAELLERTRAIAEGVGGLPETTTRDQARTRAGTSEVYAGSVKLAPVDELPWPFRAPDPAPPPVFAPIELRPVEWRDADGELVLGWSIRG